jgi:ketosteroid isomerase-like protein
MNISIFLNMKITYFLLAGILMNVSCSNSTDKEEIKKEIYQAEKAFEKMTSEKGIAEAFYYFADENAVIKRGNDSLIIGKENIKFYYDKGNYTNATVNWTPDFIDVSNCGTLGYTYGKYVWKIQNTDGKTVEYKGVFHTVWKKQKDNTWRYVWD